MRIQNSLREKYQESPTTVFWMVSPVTCKSILHLNDTFTCPFGTFAYTRMPFGLCNAPSTFQHCMTIFSDLL
ncbi:hypothetical protein CR513_20273, partial [Mucuna pruriens]